MRELHLEGLRQARERKAALTPEVRALVETAVAQFHGRLVRSFCGPEAEKKGYMPAYAATVEEYRAYRELHPAMHRWAEWEKSLDLSI